MFLEPIFKLGNLVDLGISFWAGNKILEPEDIGIEEVPAGYKLEKRCLLPKSEISKFVNLSQRIRRNFINSSFTFPFGTARYMPNTAFLRFKASSDPLVQRYLNLVEEFKENYWKHKITMRKSFLEDASRAYRSTKTDKSEEEFVNDFLEHIETLYPKLEELKSQYGVTFRVFKIGYPDLSTSMEESEQDEKTKELQEFYQKDMSVKMEKFVEDVVKEARQKIVGPFRKALRSMMEDKWFPVNIPSNLKKSIRTFQAVDFYGDKFVIQAINKLKANILSKKSARVILKDKELQDILRIHIGDILKIASHPKSTERAVLEFKNKLLGRDL